MKGGGVTLIVDRQVVQGTRGHAQCKGKPSSGYRSTPKNLQTKYADPDFFAVSGYYNKKLQNRDANPDPTDLKDLKSFTHQIIYSQLNLRSIFFLSNLMVFLVTGNRN